MHELAATFIRDEANASPLITVTSVDVSPDLRCATIFVSVFPKAQEAQALIFLKRKAGAFHSFVKQNARLKDIPHFDFASNYGEKNRQILDEIAYEQTKREKNDG
jgi:ribosome-binding factor A